MRTLTRSATLGLVASVAIMTAAATAHAGPTELTLTATPTTLEVGASFVLDGTGWVCGPDLPVTIAGTGGQPQPFGTITVTNAEGAFSQTFTAPTEAGDYDVAVSNGECENIRTVRITVTLAATTTTTTTTLAPTTTTTTTTTTLAPTTTQAVTTTSLAIAPVLPVTGDGSDRTAWAAIALLVGGAGLAWLARRPTRA